jgi:hypothetical protein
MHEAKLSVDSLLVKPMAKRFMEHKTYADYFLAIPNGYHGRKKKPIVKCSKSGMPTAKSIAFLEQLANNKRKIMFHMSSLIILEK